MARRTIRSIGIDTSRRTFLSSAPVVMLAGMGALSGCARGSSSHAGRRARTAIDGQPLDFDAAQGLEVVNRERRKRFLTPLRRDERLQLAAGRHADMMGERGLYGHEIGPGTDFVSRIHAVGYDNSAGENIGVGYGSVEEAVQGWLDSPSHRKNMLKPHYSVAGLGYSFNRSGRNTHYTHFWVLIMGRPDGGSPSS